MTSTTDTAGHPDVAEISDLTEGLLPPSRSADVRRHLDGCELCADVHASLEEIRSLLGAVPGPPRMPADVAGRIDAALAAEALLNATAPDHLDAPAPADAAQAVSDTDDSTRVSRETSPAADRPAGHARGSTTGPGRKNRLRGKRRKVAVLGAAFTAAALGLGSVLLTSLMGGSPSGPTAEGRHSTAADTFSEEKLEKQVDSLLAKNDSSGGGSRTPDLGVEGGPDGQSPRILKQSTVPECIQKGIGRSDQALATEKGVFQGKDVLLVVLPDTSDTARVTAYLVESTCVDHPSSTKAEILLKDSYTHP
ncbi:anti-sigma factor family protein [Streptomyces sp. NPDC002888]|uniref:anti-sigma factor family protein n=1 Tax=Streptomyces sp. NPDC002888 TaxID=3364668 RepID=UPI00369CCF56